MEEGDYIHKLLKIKNNSKKFFRKHSLFLGAISVAVFSVFLIVVSAKTILVSSQETSLAEKRIDPPNNGSFLSPVRNFVGEFPEMSFFQKDSLIGIAPTAVISPKSLGSVISDNRPNRGTEIAKYIVKPGDTLSLIAKKFGLSLNTILWANNLNANSRLKVGQEITILPVDGLVHIVKKGETLSEVAKTYKADPEAIVSFNNLSSPGEIFENQALIIPGGKMPPARYYYATKRTRANLPHSTNDFYGLSFHYPWGQCTYWVAQRRAIPLNLGNAKDWLNNAIAFSSFRVCKGSYCQPEVGAVVSLKGSSLGHVAYVEKVEGNRIIFSEMNYLGLGKVDYRSMKIGDPRIFGYIYKP